MEVCATEDLPQALARQITLVGSLLVFVFSWYLFTMWKASFFHQPLSPYLPSHKIYQLLLITKTPLVSASPHLSEVCLFWLSRWRSWRAWPITLWWAVCPAKCSTCSAHFPRRSPWISTTSARWSWTWRSPGGTETCSPHLSFILDRLNIFIQVFYTVSHTYFFFCFFSPFDKDDQTSSTSTVSKRLLSNQSPPDTPSMREQVFYVSHIKGAPSHLLLHY